MRFEPIQELQPGFTPGDSKGINIQDLRTKTPLEPPKPVVAQPPTEPKTEDNEVEVTAEVEEGFFSKLWDSLKGITGATTSDTDGEGFSPWMVMLLVVILGIVLYFVVVELFDW